MIFVRSALDTWRLHLNHQQGSPYGGDDILEELQPAYISFIVLLLCGSIPGRKLPTGAVLDLGLTDGLYSGHMLLAPIARD